MKRWIKRPQFRIGDIVMQGDALGYQGTFDIAGNIEDFPEELLKYVGNIYLHDVDNDNNCIYRVEFLTDEDHLFKENYDRFFNKVFKILEDNGFEIID